MTRRIAVRDSGLSKIGWVEHDGVSWVAVDDRHGSAYATKHVTRADAEQAVARRVTHRQMPPGTAVDSVTDRLVDLADIVTRSLRNGYTMPVSRATAREIYEQAAVLLAAVEDGCAL